MVMTKEDIPKKRGRKPGVKMTPKIKLKHSPKTAREDFLKAYKGVTYFGVYGIDKFTKEIINYLWKNPEISFLVTDPNQSVLDNVNKEFGQRSFSMYRWEAVKTSNFIETPQVDVIIVSSRYIDEVRKRPNPENVQLVVLEDI
ncbi:hypothetical protein OAC63_05140, partial [Amylibacter sp.]|jgi:hypothetical protein|nr:hypothetical protein [Amylibacter sp.]